VAKTAMTQLDEQIGAIRKEAYDAGYAAALQALREFASRPPNAATSALAGTARKSTTAVKPQPRRAATTASKPQSKAPRSRPQGGSNALLIAEVLKGMPGSTRAAGIRKALQRDKGVSISFTSLRHALDQLAKRGEVKASADRKEWRYVGGASS
jgi:hypothetical protein